MSEHSATAQAVWDPRPDQALEQLLQNRHSCRRFLGHEVSKETIGRLLQLAQRSPSWCNTQPWEVIVTAGPGTDRFREAISAHAAQAGDRFAPDFELPREYHGVYLQRRRESGWQLYESLGIERGDRVASAAQALENYRLFEAPHVAIVTVDARLGTYGAVDGGLYLAHFLLAAEALGIACVPQAALAMHSEFIHDFFELPTDRKVLAGISFGYPDEDAPANSYRTSRAPLDDVVRWVTV